MARGARNEQSSFTEEAKAPPNLVAVGVELKASLEYCEALQPDTACIRNGTKIPTKGGGAQPRI